LDAGRGFFGIKELPRYKRFCGTCFTGIVLFQSGGWIGGNADINSPTLKTSDGINEKSLGRHTSVIPEGLPACPTGRRAGNPQPRGFFTRPVVSKSRKAYHT
jgi:hypothetical protein